MADSDLTLPATVATELAGGVLEELAQKAAKSLRVGRFYTLCVSGQGHPVR